MNEDEHQPDHHDQPDEHQPDHHDRPDEHQPDEHQPDERLLEHIGEIGRELSDADGLEQTLQQIVRQGHTLLERCDGVSLMLIDRGGGIETPAASTPVAQASDHAQYEADEGPCLQALRERETVVIDDLETDDRWPGYRRLALDLGVRSMLSLRLYVTADSMGALNMYSRRPHAFGDRAQLVGKVFAAQASVAMKAALIQAGLETAIQSRDVIGQAKGIVMARRRLTADMAFELLRRQSQERNRKLVEIAEEITRTGEVPATREA